MSITINGTVVFTDPGTPLHQIPEFRAQLEENHQNPVVSLIDHDGRNTQIHRNDHGEFAYPVREGDQIHVLPWRATYGARGPMKARLH